MGVLAPAPSVLGSVSLMALVEGICCLHLCICAYFLSQVSSVEPAVMGGVEVGPSAQCIVGAWFLLGVPVTIYGAVGALFKVGSHLAVYLAYLSGSMILICAAATSFIMYGSTCAPPAEDDAAAMESLQGSFTCGASFAIVLLWLLVLLLGTATAIYLVWSLKDYIQRRLETELVRYMEPWDVLRRLADEVAEEEAAQPLTHPVGWPIEAPADWKPMPMPMMGGPAAPSYAGW